MTHQHMGVNRQPNDMVIRWENTSGELVPAFGVVQADSFDNDSVTYSVIKPDGDGSLFFLNGPTAVPAGKFGNSQPWNGKALIALIDTSDAEIALGSDLSPTEGEWFLSNGSDYKVVSNVDSGEASVLPNGGSGSGATILFEISSVDTSCKDYAVVEVLGGPCGSTPVRSDVLNVFDEAGCFFDLPDNEFSNLVGVRGFAVQLEMPFADSTRSCPEKPECRWVITQLCCPDPI